MLKTLDNYITDAPSQEWLLEPVWRQVGRSPRFTKIFVASIACHLIFYVTIIAWNWYAMRHPSPQASRQPDLVKIAELAPPSDKMPRLRSQAEALERADTAKLQFDPAEANDVNLTTRSPKPTTAKGVDTKLPSAAQIENHISASRGTADTGEPAKSTTPVRPPETAPVSTSRTPQAETTVAASGIPTPNTPVLPVPPAPKPSGSASTNTASPNAPAGKPHGDSADSAALGLQAAQAQYMAYVRTKIRTKNEQIMPRYYIETLLANTVSTDFRIIIGRGGQILSTDLVRSCGYKQLDDVARQAIQLAKPFEGYPPNAGDTITLTVTVYYTPGR